VSPGARILCLAKVGAIGLHMSFWVSLLSFFIPKNLLYCFDFSFIHTRKSKFLARKRKDKQKLLSNQFELHDLKWIW
jgi:hypothetical protein